MKSASWKDIAELIGLAAIVASLVFVGMELRQTQKDSRIESGLTRAGWFFENRNAINDHAGVWVKAYSGEPLSEEESVIFSNLIRNIHTNNRFSWSRERTLGSTSDYPAHELAWILSKSPAAVQAWEEYQSDIDEMRRTLAIGDPKNSDEFAEIVRADLQKLMEARD